jgi:hypothetical protein
MGHERLRAPGTPSYTHPSSGVLLLHSRIHVTDVPARSTSRASARPPGLGHQLLHPRDLEACEPRVLPRYLRDCQRHQDTVIGGASCQSTSVCYTRGLAPHGEGRSLQRTGDSVTTVALRLHLQDLLSKRPPGLTMGGHQRDEGALHETFLCSPR